MCTNLYIIYHARREDGPVKVTLSHMVTVLKPTESSVVQRIKVCACMCFCVYA